MSRPYYAPKQVYVGTGSLDTYTFDFKIESLAQLLIVVVDDNDTETERVLGTDNTYLSSVTFDSVAGGGTVILLASLPANYNLIILQANDEPSQSYEFSNKLSFSLKRFENALDFIVGPIQRLSFRARQSLRIHDVDDEEVFNSQLPPGIVPDATLAVDPTGVKFIYGPTVTEIEGWKIAAENAAAAALVSEGLANGSAIDAAANEVAAAASAAAALVSEAAALASAAAALVSETNAAASAVSALAAASFGFGGLQNIASNGKINLSTNLRQMIDVQGSGGPQDANVLPFSSAPTTGTEIILLGQDNAKVLTIFHNDAAGGCLLKGDMYLGLNQSLTLIYNLTKDRYIETARSV